MYYEQREATTDPPGCLDCAADLLSNDYRVDWLAIRQSGSLAGSGLLYPLDYPLVLLGILPLARAKIGSDIIILLDNKG